MKYGQTYTAGLSFSTVIASLDFETYSEAGYYWDGSRWRGIQSGKPGLKSVGAWVYSRHPSTQAYCLAYDLKDDFGQRLWIPGMPPPLDLFEHLRQGLLVEAHYSFFEYCIWMNVCVRRYGWPPINLRLLRDSAAKAGAWTLPRKLEAVAKVLGTAAQKDMEGARIMRKLSVPRSPTKGDPRLRYTPGDAPEDFAKLYSYCGDDVRAEDAVSLLCPDLSPIEQEYQLIDQEINTRGVLCDREAVDAARSLIVQSEKRYFAELATITDEAVRTPDQLDNMKAWLLTQGVYAPSITKDTMPDLLAQTMSPDAHRVLEIRQAMGSKSVTKTAAMHYTMDPETSRIHGLYTYAGASRTSRWAGGGAQTQNLPKEGPPVIRCTSCNAVRWKKLAFCPHCLNTESKPAQWGIEATESCLAALKTRDMPYVESLWGDTLKAISGCLRSFFMAAPGHEFVSSDFSAIEAVVMAELAGEEWQRQVFRTHGKIYEMTASKITGVPFSEFERHLRVEGIHHPLRKLGKVGSLASMYQGWINAWIKFGADEFLNEEEIKTNVLAWRAANTAIVSFWAELEGAAIMAIDNPGAIVPCRSNISYQMHEGCLYCHLPSGRSIPYHQAQVYETERFDKPHRAIRYAGLSQQTQWVWMDLYGGKQAENITQAVARDRFAYSMPLLEAAGYPIVMHTHDEFTCEVPLGFGSIEEVEAIMGQNPGWCSDWPIKATGGWRGLRYRKDG